MEEYFIIVFYAGLVTFLTVVQTFIGKLLGGVPLPFSLLPVPPSSSQFTPLKSVNAEADLCTAASCKTKWKQLETRAIQGLCWAAVPFPELWDQEGSTPSPRGWGWTRGGASSGFSSPLLQKVDSTWIKTFTLGVVITQPEFK